MKKTFPLQVPDKEDRRVLEAVKLEVRKYVKRERRKALPAGAGRWDFACRVGRDETSAESKTVAEVVDAIETVAKSGATAVYVEILAVAGHQAARAAHKEPGTDAVQAAE